MKNLYVCEYCGKTYTDYDAALSCERRHVSVDQIYSWELPHDTDLKTEFYAEGESSPEYVVLKAADMDSDGFFKQATMPNGNYVTCYHAVVYKRVDKVKLPNGMTPNDYTVALRERQLADNSVTEDTKG